MKALTPRNGEFRPFAMKAPPIIAVTTHNAARRRFGLHRIGAARAPMGNTYARPSHTGRPTFEPDHPNLASGQLHLATSARTRSKDPCACVQDHAKTSVFAPMVPLAAAVRIADRYGMIHHSASGIAQAATRPRNRKARTNPARPVPLNAVATKGSARNHKSNIASSGGLSERYAAPNVITASSRGRRAGEPLAASMVSAALQPTSAINNAIKKLGRLTMISGLKAPITPATNTITARRVRRAAAAATPEAANANRQAKKSLCANASVPPSKCATSMNRTSIQRTIS